MYTQGLLKLSMDDLSYIQEETLCRSTWRLAGVTAAVGAALQVALAVGVIGTQLDAYADRVGIKIWTLAGLTCQPVDHVRY